MDARTERPELDDTQIVIHGIYNGGVCRALRECHRRPYSIVLYSAALFAHQRGLPSIAPSHLARTQRSGDNDGVEYYSPP